MACLKSPFKELQLRFLSGYGVNSSIDRELANCVQGTGVQSHRYIN